MIGTLTDTEIGALVAEQQFARLGCHHNGKTYVVPISFAVDDNGLVGQTTHGLKVEMMRGNPNVCVELDDIRDLTNWRSVILTGFYEELTGVEAATAMGLLIDKYGPVFEEMGAIGRRGRDVTPPRLDAQPSVQVVYRIHVLEKSGRIERPV